MSAVDVELHSGMLGAIDCARVLLGRDLGPDEDSALRVAYREAAKATRN